jgi:polyphenol oxidase
LKNNPDMQHVFKMTSAGDCCMDLYEIARLQLIQAGVDSNRISMAIKNTFTDPDLHSARREGALSGRMATLVWMD